MTKLLDQSAVTKPLSHSCRSPDPPWLWLKLVGGSLIIHFILLSIALPLTVRMSASQAQGNAVASVDLVELPTEDTTSAPAEFGTPVPAAVEAPTTAPVAPENVSSNQTDVIPGDIALASEMPSQPTQQPAEPTPIANSEPPPALPQTAPAPTPAIASPSQSTPLVSPSSNPVEPPPAVPESPLMQGIVDQPEFSRTEISENPRPGESLTTSPAEPTAAPGPDGATGQSEEPEPTPTEPPFSPIEVPVPQDPGRLDIPESNPEGLGETEVEESPVPTRLIARISHQPIAQQDSNDVGMGDQPARPIQDRETFVSDPTVSACTVNPAVMTSLGTAVGLRVATDASGAVIEAIVQQSSQNPAYDELAACLVNNWQFEPAMYQGQPVDNDQLLVYITIEPEE